MAILAVNGVTILDIAKKKNLRVEEFHINNGAVREYNILCDMPGFTSGAMGLETKGLWMNRVHGWMDSGKSSFCQQNWKEHF